MNAPKIRIMVVDDSVVMRRLIHDVLSAEDGIEVVASAADGQIALTKLGQYSPDVVTLDIEMPRLNGLEALKQIRVMHPGVRVIMFSTLTEMGAAATLDALALGADDYVTKPSNTSGVAMAAQKIREQLVPKIRALCSLPRVHLVSKTPVDTSPRAVTTRRAFFIPRPIEVVVIGTSTGGPNALAAVIPSLPRELPVPILVVQHMPPLFTQLLAQRLAALSGLSVKEAAPGDIVEPGRVWIAPGDFHMTVRREHGVVRVVTHKEPAENSCRPAADVLFRGTADVYGPGVLAVVMTGMGQDGLRGCEQIFQAGGQIIVQDEATSVVWGMPGFVARAGLAEKIVPLPEIAGEITRKVRMYRAQNRPVATT